MASVFLNYARSDRQLVERLYKALVEEGYSPWMDRHSILPGEDFRLAIDKAITTCDSFLACLSRQAVNRRGELQAEIQRALELRRRLLPDDIYLIPVRLEECEVPQSLQHLEYVDWFQAGGRPRLVAALRVAMDRRGIEGAEDDAGPQRGERHPARFSADGWTGARRAALGSVLVAKFDREELEQLCEGINVLLERDRVEVRGSVRLETATKSGGRLPGTVRELIGWLDRRRWLDYLVEAIESERPGLLEDLV